MKNGKQPAFAAVCDNTNPYLQEGLTKREYFAGLAMQGLLARNPNRQNGETDLGMLEANRIAEESVVMADFILEALEKEGE